MLCEDTKELDGNKQDFQKRGESNEDAVLQYLYKDLDCVKTGQLITCQTLDTRDGW